MKSIALLILHVFVSLAVPPSNPALQRAPPLVRTPHVRPAPLRTRLHRFHASRKELESSAPLRGNLVDVERVSVVPLRSRRAVRVRTAIAGVNTPQGDIPEGYWKDGFYTNWTYGKLLEDKKVLESPPSPSDVIVSGKQAGAKIRNIIAALFRQIYLTLRNPIRLPRGIINGCKHLGHELVHYWQGLKLLCADISTASGLFKKYIASGKLTWREKRQLNRAFSDVFRLVPMAVFLLVPLFEFLLPLALKIFPEMLPSQFHKRDLREANLKKELKMRLRTAAFLQDTLNNVIKSSKIKAEPELSKLLDDVRKGNRVDNQALTQVAFMFTDEITLDSLEHIQLAALCRMVGLRPLGPTPYLRKLLRKKLKQIKEDDIEISVLGVDNMTNDELMAACRERGMRTLGLTPAGYRQNLKNWISLSIDSELPNSLLLLSRAFTILERNPNPQETLRKALENVDHAVDEVIFDSGADMDAGERLKFLAEQNKLIKADQEMQTRSEEKQVVIINERSKVINDAIAKAAQAASGQDSGPAGVVFRQNLEDSDLKEDEIRAIAEELEELLKDPYTTEREALRRLRGLPDETAVPVAKGAPMVAAKVLDNDKLNLHQMDAPVAVESNNPGMMEVNKGEVEGEGESMIERRLRARLRDTLNKIEKRIESAEKITSARSERAELDNDRDGCLSQEEIINVLTTSIIEFQGQPEQAERVAKVLAQRCGNWAGEISVSELLAMANELRAEEEEYIELSPPNPIPADTNTPRTP